MQTATQVKRLTKMVDFITLAPKVHLEFFNFVGVAIITTSLAFTAKSGFLPTDIVATPEGLGTKHFITVRGAGFVVHGLPVAFTAVCTIGYLVENIEVG